jgi:hypothetical protein
MKKLRLALFSLGMVLAASLALSCGANSNSNTTGQLQSITISPATASSQGGLPAPQIQFTATGHYNTAPYAVTPQPATWGACYQNAPTTAVAVTSAGAAQCVDASGPTVEYSIFAFDQTNCNLINACGGGCTIVGTAQLSCSGTEADAALAQHPEK